MSHSRKGGSDDTFMFVMTVITVGMVVALCVSDCSKRGRPATVIDRTHTPSTISVGMTSNGDMVTTGNAETWELILRDKDGNVYALDVTPEVWAGHAPGSDFNKPQAEAMPEGAKP